MRSEPTSKEKDTEIQKKKTLKWLNYEYYWNSFFIKEIKKEKIVLLINYTSH